jgi:hypothetical protein
MMLKLSSLATVWVLSSAALTAQNVESAVFHINNVKAVIQSNGALFHAGQNGGFIAPYEPGMPELSTMRAAGVWMAGLDPAGNLRGAVHLYGENGRADFQPGTVDPDTGDPTDLVTGFYRVTRADILEHIADFEDNGVIDNPNPRVFGWPARGNAFFSSYHDGAMLPNTSQGLAPFLDYNGTGHYDPDGGDHPTVEIRNCWNEPAGVIPDEMLWFVFNDNRLHTESGMPAMKVEIQCTVFGFNCEESPVGNTVFVLYKIINRGLEDLDAAYFGLFADFAIGNPDDDFFGSDASRSLIFGYNGDDDDEGAYGVNAPVMAVDMLRGPVAVIDNALVELPLAHVMPVEPGSLTSGESFYNLLSGSYADGAPAPNNGFFYDGNPTVPGEWSEVEEGNAPGDRKTVSSYGPFKLQPGAVNELIAAFTFYRAPGATPADNLQLMYEQADEVQALFDNCFDPDTAPPCTAVPTSVRPGKKNAATLKAFPNPFSSELAVDFTDWPATPVWIELATPTGRIVWSRRYQSGGNESLSLPAEALPAGVYWLVVTDENGGKAVAKVVKM